ncbi:MAG: FitA-like ribbon-helix-helix domain-containing protein [Gammaproteobacteria bacterium]
MPTLTIRNLPENVHAALRLRAAQDGLSVEAEVRNILTEACLRAKKPVADLQLTVEQLYQGKKPGNEVEQLLKERRLAAKNE